MEIQSQSTTTPPVSVPASGSSAATVQVPGAASAAASTVTAPAPAPAAKIDQKQLEAAVQSIDKFINVTQPPKLAFSIDADTEQPVVRITDASTGELIRQIPSQEALDIASSLDKAQGLLLKQQA